MVSDTGFHGRLTHCEGSERQTVSSKGGKERAGERPREQNEKSGQRHAEGNSDGEKRIQKEELERLTREKAHVMAPP